MPGEFNDLIPTPRRKPAQRFEPTPFEQILAGPNEGVDPLGPPHPAPVFGAPEVIPERKAEQARPTMADRLLNSIARGANRAIEAGGPIGFDPETVAMLRNAGLFNRDPSNPTLLGTANEVFIGGGTALADLGLRALAAAGEGGISGFGQLLREAGVSQGGARRAERDLRAGLTALGLGGAAAPMALSQVPTAVGVRRTKPPMFKPAAVRPILRQPSSDEDFRFEIEHVLDTGESSIGQLWNPHVGPIRIDLGFPGEGPKFEGGFGLSHIAAKRTAVDRMDGNRFVRERLPQVLARGKLQEFQDKGTRRRAILDLGGDRAVLRLFRDNQRETWVLTGFKRKQK